MLSTCDFHSAIIIFCFEDLQISGHNKFQIRQRSRLLCLMVWPGHEFDRAGNFEFDIKSL